MSTPVEYAAGQGSGLNARGAGLARPVRAPEIGPPPGLVTGQWTRRPSHPDVTPELEPQGARFPN